MILIIQSLSNINIEMAVMKFFSKAPK